MPKSLSFLVLATAFVAGLLSPRLVVAHGLATDPHASMVNDPDDRVHWQLDAEFGALLPVFHVIQFSNDGSRIDYVRDAGQDNLFFFSRFATSLRLDDKHQFEFLYQPLDLRTTDRPENDLVIDGAVFPADRPIDFRYGFSFYRATWLRDLVKAPETRVAVGVAGQIRNATIEFTAVDGSQSRTNRDIGFVPLLAFRAEHDRPNRLWLGGEAIGFYAPIKYINGGRSDVEGAIADIAAKVGLRHRHGLRSALTLRYIGGGATGTERSPREPADGYVKNWIHTLVLGVGVSVR